MDRHSPAGAPAADARCNQRHVGRPRPCRPGFGWPASACHPVTLRSALRRPRFVPLARSVGDLPPAARSFQNYDVFGRPFGTRPGQARRCRPAAHPHRVAGRPPGLWGAQPATATPSPPPKLGGTGPPGTFARVWGSAPELPGLSEASRVSDPSQPGRTGRPSAVSLGTGVIRVSSRCFVDRNVLDTRGSPSRPI